MERFALRWLFCGALVALCVAFASARDARGGALKKEVPLLGAKGQVDEAAMRAAIAQGRPVQTGAGAQIEMRFDNGLLVRLGQNSIFAAKQGTSRMELRRGAMLVRVPKSAGQTLITSGAVVSSLGGTTALLEHYPDAYTKLISLEGTARMFMPAKIGESVLVDAGQLLMFHLKPAPKALPNPVDIDIKRLIATSQLIRGFAPLESELSIARGAQNQSRQKSGGTLTETNLVIFGRGTLVSLVPPETDTNPTTPTPTPSPSRQ